MLQVRITDSDGMNAIILENAKDKSYSKTINASDEGLTFAIAKNDPKADVLNPDTTGYSKFWEIWDTENNTRLNYGAISSIAEQGEDWKIEGTGASSLLLDHYKTTKTFYTAINTIISDIRFENLAIKPRTRTLIHNQESSTSVRGGQQDYIFGSPTVSDDTSVFYNLSKQSKDNAVDENTGQFRIGEIEPPISYFTTDSFWTGSSANDSLIVDLGDTYDVRRIKMLFPWWGGAERGNNRAYDFELAYATDTPVVQSISGIGDFGAFTTIYDSDTFARGPWDSNHYFRTPLGNRIVTTPDRPYEFYIGKTASGYGTGLNSFFIGLNQDGPISARYIRAHITGVRAWYGTTLDDDPSIDGYRYQCDPDYVNGDVSGINKVKGIMTGKTFSDRVINNASDCNASIVEMGIYKEIMARDVIKPLALQRIDNNNPQITYLHTPAATETFQSAVIDGAHYRKFEPGSFFRQFTVQWSSAPTNYTKFYKHDCPNCYPDGFHFGIVDQNNSLIYWSDDSSGTATVRGAAFTKHLLMRGSAGTAVITSCDAWPANLDNLSWGGSYSFTRITGDTAVIHFRGESFRWYATVPANETGATVKVEIRSRPDGSSWTGWSTLDAGLVLPSDINSEIVFEIPYEDAYLQPSTVYEIKLTNLGGFCSIDSIEGFWAGSYTEYNEDSRRLFQTKPANLIQLYDRRFTGGSIYKWNKRSSINMQFEGDRAVILSAKGRNHGKLRIAIFKYIDTAQFDPGLADHVLIPGGDADGSIQVNLNTSKRGAEIPSAVIFDSNDYADLLPWGRYVISVAYTDVTTYSATKADGASSNFVYRCSSCKPAKGSRTINRWVYLDGIGVHEAVGLSVSFENETHLEILKSVAEATQTEWEVTGDGIRLEPRIGQDTDEVLREGQNTLVDFDIVNDVSQMASLLISTGADIDGLPLYALSEQKSTEDRLGRTVTRQQDFRNTADYFQLVGLSRTELKRRAYPEKRITVTHTARNLNLTEGDSFILYTHKMGPLRVRINRIEINESSPSGREYSLECVRWPPIT